MKSTLDLIRQVRETLELSEGDHPINYPFYVMMKTKELVMWFKVTGVNKGGGYTGFQVDRWLDKKTPSKAVTKTIPKHAKDSYKHVPAHEVPENIMKRFAGTSDGGKKIGGDPEAKLAVKSDEAAKPDPDDDNDAFFAAMKKKMDTMMKTPEGKAQVMRFLQAASKMRKESNKRDRQANDHDYDESIIDKIRGQITAIVELSDNIDAIEKAVMKGLKKLKGKDADLKAVTMQIGKWDAKEIFGVIDRMSRMGKVRYDGKYYSLN